MITLLAMAPAGEVFFTRDASGQAWEHRSLGAHDPLPVSDVVVDRVVSDFGYVRVGVSVKSWAEIADLIDREVRTVPVADVVITRTLARTFLPLIDRWLVSSTERRQVVSLVTRLLDNDDVRTDRGLWQELMARLKAGLGPPPVRTPSVEAANGQSRLGVPFEFLVPAA
jgi:hypothetical protein